SKPMSGLKLRSNIMQLICRTCLKMHKEKYDIFQHSENNKLVADIIMECVPIKIHKNDDFPIHICNNCLEKVKTSWDFRLSAIESDVKLHNFYKARNNPETPNKLQCS
ncbi:zinc-finger associated domain containing protein, partial [Oryctes borbonicus]